MCAGERVGGMIACNESEQESAAIVVCSHGRQHHAVVILKYSKTSRLRRWAREGWDESMLHDRTEKLLTDPHVEILYWEHDLQVLRADEMLESGEVERHTIVGAVDDDSLLLAALW